MKKLLSVACVSFACSLTLPVLAQTPAAAPAAPAKTAQQNKMTTCSKEAAGKKGDEHKAFMKTCLSNKPA